MHHHDVLDTYSQQDIDLDKVFQDVAVYNARVMGPTHMRAVANLACRKALSNRAVAHITVPVDFQDMEVDYKEQKSSKNIKGHSAIVRSYPLPAPPPELVTEAAKVIDEGKKPVILAGRGALGASDELVEFADKIGAPIVKALLGKACVDDDHPLTTGGIGLLGTEPSEDAMEECDTLIMVGTSFPYEEFYPDMDQARAVQIDIDTSRIGLRYPIEVAVTADSKKALKALIPRVKRKEDRSFLEKAQKGMKDWEEKMLKLATRDDTPVKPQVVAWELGKRLSRNAVVSCDSGTNTTWWARHIHAKVGQMHSCSGTLATMACGLPYAIAAAVAYPERESIAFIGDGGFSMLMAEFATCVKYELPVKIVVIKNNTLGQIKWEQMAFLGNPEFACDLHPIDFVNLRRRAAPKAFPLKQERTRKKSLNRPWRLQVLFL